MGETSDAAVLVETRDRKMYITLNRPEVLNAQNTAMRDGLIEAFERLDADDDLVVGILRGAGRSFSAGADMKEAAHRRAAEDGRRSEYGNAHFHLADRLTKPLIAVLHGHAVGGGLEIALCCDLRVATEDAQLGTPEPRTNGGMPGIAVHRLARMIPTGEALKILLTSHFISGQRAYEIGLVQEVAPDIDAAMAIADQLADQMLECNPIALTSMKQTARWPLLNDISSSTRFLDLARGGMTRLDRGSFNGADYLAKRRAGREGK
ncbi:MAG: enoyl-CoA hydratase/isomerase family protein [Acidobacteria bacterium]|nr:enoyl-CoA hydratase/isomerase family protein [Acidobacteriota bacterium]